MGAPGLGAEASHHGPRRRHRASRSARHLPSAHAARHLSRPRICRSSTSRSRTAAWIPRRWKAIITYYYEYHFLYINGIEHVESKSIQGTALLKLHVPSGHRHGAGDGADGRLRQPRARLHAAGHGAALHHALRRRQRAGRLSGLLERRPAASARSRTSRSIACGRCSRRCPACRRRRRSAAASARSSSASIPIGCARTTCRPDEVIAAVTPATSIMPVGQREHRRSDRASRRSTRSSRHQASSRALPIRTGAGPPVFVRDVGHGRRQHRYRHRLRAGQRPARRLHPGHQARRRLDAGAWSTRSRRTCRSSRRCVPDDIKVQLRARPVADTSTRAIRGLVTEGAARRAADRPDGAAVPARLAQRADRRRRRFRFALLAAVRRAVGCAGRPSTS